MALVQNSLSDFVLFPRDQTFFEMNQDDSNAQFQYCLNPDLQQEFDMSQSTFDSFQGLSAFAPTEQAYFETPQLVVNGPRDTLKQPHQRYTPLASPSLSASHSLDHAPSNLSHNSGTSGQSTASSAVGSPYSHTTHSLPGQEPWMNPPHGLGIAPGIVHNEYGTESFTFQGEGDQLNYDNVKFPDSFVDPSLIQPYDMPAPPHATPSPYQTTPQQFHPAPHMFQPPSPALSDASSQDSYRTGSRQFRSGNQSPYLHNMTYQPYPPPAQGRRPSVSSLHSRYSSHGSPRSASLGYDEEGKERCRCPNPDCGRYFKDLKAHMLTHQSERPEKCPIVTCEYHQKGFARKYDKNRHTLTHYKGTMVCGFCPGGGSPAEKSFNRADVFKRHLTSVHGVEQTAPNSRKKSPGLSSSKKSTTSSQEAAGKCSTCSAMFNNAQDLYNHLDDCIYAQLENEEPSEAINERRLAEVANDKAVHETLDRNMVSSSLPSSTESGAGLEEEDEEEDDDDVDEDANDSTWTGPGGIGSRSGKGGIKSTKRNNNNNSS